jgi:hypothetical protein
MTIMLNPHAYLNSPNLPGRTRGYTFSAGTFSLQIGSVTTTLSSPLTTAYFVLRNNDPRVDGFFISQGTEVDSPVELAMAPAGFGIAFSRTFNNVPPPPSTQPDPTLSSLDLAGAVGSWGLENFSSYNFGVQQGEFSVPMVLEYQRITITECARINSGPWPGVFCGSGQAAFAVGAAGTGPLSYEWQVRGVESASWTTLTPGSNTVPGVGQIGASGVGTPGVTLSNLGMTANWASVRCLVSNACGTVESPHASLSIPTSDFNQDGDFGTDADIEAFFWCLACSCECGQDFDGDGDFGTDADIESFFRVLAGGTC